MAVYGAASAASHGIGGMSGKTDMAVGSVEVYGGEFLFSSEIAVNSVILDGGGIGFSSPESVGSFSVNGGSILYKGEIRADSLSVAAPGEVKVVFSAEDLAAQEIVVFDFGYLSEEFDAGIFAAYDELGNKMGGEFFLNGSAGGPGTLVYSVPEPAALSAALGILAASAAFAARRFRG